MARKKFRPHTGFGYDPKDEFPTLEKKYDALRKRTIEALDFGELQHTVDWDTKKRTAYPQDWIRWLIKYKIEVDDDLITELLNRFRKMAYLRGQNSVRSPKQKEEELNKRMDAIAALRQKGKLKESDNE